MSGPQQLSNEDVAALSFAFLVSGIAEATASTATALFSTSPIGFGISDSLPFIAAIAATPLIALVVRRHTARRALLAAHAVMLLGALTLFIDGYRMATLVSLSLLSVGHQVIAATLLIGAWRARRSVTAVLAGVFVLPSVLDPAVIGELLRSEGLDRTFLLTVAVGLLVLSLAFAAVMRSHDPGRTTGERSLERSLILGGSVALAGSAMIATHTPPYEAGPGTGIALALVLAGLVMISPAARSIKLIRVDSIVGVAVDRIGTMVGIRPEPDPAPTESTPPAIHLDRDLLLLLLVLSAAVLIPWVDFGPTFLRGASVPGFPGVRPSFDDGILWSRVISVMLVIAAIPTIVAVARIGKRALSIGPAAVAVAGLGWAFLVLDDLEYSLVEFVGFTLLTEWGTMIVVGGTVALALRRIDGATLEGGVIALLAGYSLLSAIIVKIPYEWLGTDFLENGADNTDDIRLFTVACAVGLIWIAAWWALRPDRDSAPIDDECQR